jgi:hypothetical protein
MKNLRLTVGLLPFALASMVSQVQAGTSGAIFTTMADGTIVNANTQYASKCQVYLSGGPGATAPAHAAALAAGDYYFQVTDPNGQTLLSTDPVSNRRFHVSSDGVITAFTGTGGPAHPTSIDQANPGLGAVTIQLANTSCPTDFMDSPNSGGVYKAWVTPVASFIGDPTQVDNACGGGCYHGFSNSASKTDNFKVKQTIPTFCLSVAKQILDAVGNPSPGFDWPISITDTLGVTNNYTTNETDGTLTVCSLVAGTYTVSESLILNSQPYFVASLAVNGASLPPQPVYSFSWTAGQAAPSIVFQNMLTSIPQ